MQNIIKMMILMFVLIVEIFTQNVNVDVRNNAYKILLWFIGNV